MRKLGERWGAGVSAEYRFVLDASAATSSWYADLAGRGQFGLNRVAIWVDAGWSWRHIALSNGIANSVGGISGGGGVAVTTLTRPGWHLDVGADFHASLVLTAQEGFGTYFAGPVARWVFEW